MAKAPSQLGILCQHCSTTDLPCPKAHQVLLAVSIFYVQSLLDSILEFLSAYYTFGTQTDFLKHKPAVERLTASVKHTRCTITSTCTLRSLCIALYLRSSFVAFVTDVSMQTCFLRSQLNNGRPPSPFHASRSTSEIPEFSSFPCNLRVFSAAICRRNEFFPQCECSIL